MENEVLFALVFYRNYLKSLSLNFSLSMLEQKLERYVFQLRNIGLYWLSRLSQILARDLMNIQQLIT
jgi:hypothetical protein